MLEAAEADLALEAGFCPCERRRNSCRALPDAPAPPKLRDQPSLDMLHDAARCIWEIARYAVAEPKAERHSGRASGNWRARSMELD
jgi:hypothetical protein